MIKSQTTIKKKNPFQTPKEKISKRKFYKSMSAKAKALFNKNRSNSNSLYNQNLNQNYIDKTPKTSKDTSINYIYQKNNPNLINPSKKIFSFMKNNQNLNDFKINKNNIFSYYNKNQENNKNVNKNENKSSENLNRTFRNKMSNIARNYRGLPQKSPISIQDGINYDKLSTNDKNSKYNINKNNSSFLAVKSNLSNHNYTVSTNMNNKTLNYKNYRYAVNNDKHIFNNYSSLTKSIVNNNNSFSNFYINNNLNKSIHFNDTSKDDILKKDKDKDGSTKQDSNNYNNNINTSYRNNTFLARNRKFLSKTPNPQKEISFIKPKNNYNSTIINNNSKSNINKSNLFGQKESKNMNFTYSNNFYKNHNPFNKNYNQESYSNINRNTYNKRNINIQVNNNFYIDNYKNKENKDSSSNINSYRFTTNNMNKTYSNSFRTSNLNPTNNNGKIINNIYNNRESKIDKLYSYKTHISQNNNNSKYIKSPKNKNDKDETKNSTKDNSDDFYKSKNINYNNSEKRLIHFYNIKKDMVRNRSSSGVGVVDKSNKNLYPKNTDNQNQAQSKISLNNINIKNIYNNNRRSKKEEENIKPPVKKKIKKIHQLTHIGFNGVKDKDFNQDITFIEKNFAGDSSYIYFGVCDGHGVVGHEVSDFIQKNLPKELSKSLNKKDILTDDTKAKKKIFNIIDDVFITVNDKLTYNDSINSLYSGTTCVSVIYTPKKLICANIGDSRAVLGRYDQNTKKWLAINLSRDHKPTEKDEAKRILNRGGRIKPFTDEVTGEEYGPQRIWVKKEEVPGLAMTRSFGDRVAASVGCICLPETKDFNFEEDDKFLILASDGIWEFIESEECINIIGKYYFSNNIESCCKYLYNESRKRWIKEEEVVDDITLLLVFFE